MPGPAGLAALGLVVLFTAALLGPVLLHPNERLYGIGGDGPGAPAGIARRLQSSEHGGLTAPLPSLLTAPFHQPRDDDAADPLWWYSGALLARVFTPIGATNALLFIAFVATAVAAYAFLRSQGLSPGTALLGAVIYGFCPIRLAEAQEHYLLLDGFWLIFEGALLLALLGRRGPLAAAALGVVIGLTELDNPYLGYFGGVLAGAWLLYLGLQAVGRRDWKALRRTAGHAILALVAVAAVVIPTQLPLLLPTTTPTTAAGALSLIRSLGDLDRLSLRWWDFLLPSPDNPVFGPLGRGAFSAHLGVDTVSEQSTMTGYVALVLAIAGLVVLLRRGRWGRHRTTHKLVPPSLLALALVCIGTGIFFGVPPSFHLGPVRLPTPPAFMHTLFPQIRTTSRIDLLIQLGIAILAAAGAESLLARTRHRHLASGALLLAVLLEYTNVPPWRYVTLLPPPAIETWLATVPPQDAGIVVQYPIAAYDMAETPVLEFYAYTVHHHPLFNGVLRDTPPDALRRNLQDVLNPTVPSAWAALGVKTVTLDTSYYRPFFGNAGLHWPATTEDGLARQLPGGLVERYSDSTSAAYAVTAPPAALVAGLGEGFGDAELHRDGRLWRWMGRQATIWLDNRTNHSVASVLWTLAHNNRTDHRLTWPGYLSVTVPAARGQSPVALAVDALPGFHSLTLGVDGPLAALAGSGDPMPVSVQLRSLEAAPVQPLNVIFAQGGQPRWELTGVSRDACTIQAGQNLSVALLWTVVAPTDADETVFLHVLASDGSLVATGDGLPSGGGVATSRVTSGSQLTDVHTLALRETLPPGLYHLEAGLYDHQTGTRLAILGGGDTASLGSITVVAPSPGPKRVTCPW